MKSRPLSVTLISFLFIIAGIAGIIYHAGELKNITTQPEEIWILLVRVLAIIGGVFTLRGANWAKWLLIAWIVFHVILSIFHSTEELIMHIVLTVIVMIALFNRKAKTFFQEK